MADLDARLAALRDAAIGSPTLDQLSPAEARARVVAGNRLCQAGPEVRVDEPGDSPVGVRVYEGSHVDATMVYAHGGGWVTGDLDYSDELCRHLAAEARLRVVSVDYRLAPEHAHPAGLDDLATAWAWAARRYSGPRALGGDSAGGNLVALLAQELATTDRPAFLVLVYPVLDLPGRHPSYVSRGHAFPLDAQSMHWFFQHYVPGVDLEDTASVPERLAPLQAPVGGLPPTHLVLAGHDPLHDEGSELAARLRASGVAVTVDDHDTLCHGFLRMTGASATAAAARSGLVTAVTQLVDGIAGSTRESRP